MEWEQKALERLDRVPFFIRKKVHRQIEDFVRQQGRQVVSDSDVTNARRALTGSLPTVNTESVMTGGTQNASGQLQLDTVKGSLTSGEVKRIEELIEKGVVREGLNTPYHQINLCGGAAGCPLTVIEDSRIADMIRDIIEESGLDEHIAGQIDGPALFHHKFKVAVSGCPNSCSQPQIADFGIVGQSQPGRGEGRCTNCRICVRNCEEEAVTLTADGPIFDYNRCLNCGHCIEACPTGAIKELFRGFHLIFGGKLGRHPRLAEELVGLAGEKELKDIFKVILRVFMEHGLDQERFAGMVERMGPETVRRKILDIARLATLGEGEAISLQPTALQ